jgi:hypothetical protein
MPQAADRIRELTLRGSPGRFGALAIREPDGSPLPHSARSQLSLPENGTQVLASRSSHRALADASGYDASEFRDSGCHKPPIGSASLRCAARLDGSPGRFGALAIREPDGSARSHSGRS